MNSFHTPEIGQMRQDGWVFDYSTETWYVTASHPRGGKKSICEVSTAGVFSEAQRYEIGKAIARILNDGTE